ncbi:flagellin N-terminal helical domain-containing protein [Metabacillus sp. B2-18]|uniref:flagellin N-terminal helical domain-containing protein n=1 Tax=Metabacillus sp. B2-18 TaxID=2897333 RepID=UPI001E63E701|nr:flagellin [Metabacillus sp. B2-18]UGB30443.1 flagellar protein [Metabacillus sp. B2-18]
MRINHNIQALNAYKNLSQTMGQTSKTLEKLSSGLRINRAADDAAGLAISEKMRSQIRGLETAERNSLDAISLIQTAEGALNETHSILQRMRELSVQAANGTLEDSDREAIQMEINQLTYEIDRIADTTQFNTKKLLSGSAEGRAFAEVNTSEVAYTANGTWSGVVTAEPTEPAKVEIQFDAALGSAASIDLEGKTFVINGKTYEIDVTDGANPGVIGDNIAVNISGWNESAATDAERMSNINKLMDSLESAIIQNDNQSLAVVKDSPTDSDAANEGTIIDGKLTLSTVNPMSPKDVQDLGTRKNISTNIASGVTFNDPATNTPTTSLVASPDSAQAKPIAITFSEVPKTGDALKIDGLTINFNSPASALTGSAATIDVTDKDLDTVLSEIDAIITQAKNANPTPVPALAPVHSVSNNSLILGTTKTDDGISPIGLPTNGLDIALIDGDFEADKGKELNVDLQIGANASESLTLSLGVMDAATLGIARNGDFSTLSTAGVNAVLGVNVSTANAAQQAITAFDKAISLVSAERSKLGAFQNRLEHTVTNLQTANENLTSAESRIRDTDMAKSMTEYTKNNILNQAGQAMLAQANQLPQGILQLLK